MDRTFRDSEILEVGRLFFRLGVAGFGGPAAHIAWMEEEIVRRRQWISREEFLDLVAVTNLIPGPNSTEMAIHIGYLRGGLPGAIVAGLAFIVPAVALTTALAWGYVRYGQLPAVEPYLAGIQPAVIAVIAGAVWRLGRVAVIGPWSAVVAAACFAASLAGIGELPILGGAALAGFLLPGGRLLAHSGEQGISAVVVSPFALGPAAVAVVGSGVAGASLWQLSLFFLKVGAVLYGSGYVLVAFIETGLVQEYGWLTATELIDAVACGQITPGPVLSTSAFVGYLVAGPSGALVSAASIFFPSFVFVAIVRRWVSRLRSNPRTAGVLDAVRSAAVALMGGVLLQLGQPLLGSAAAWGVLGAAGLAVFRWRIQPLWIVIGGAILGRILGVPWSA